MHLGGCGGLAEDFVSKSANSKVHYPFPFKFHDSTSRMIGPCSSNFRMDGGVHGDQKCLHPAPELYYTLDMTTTLQKKDIYMRVYSLPKVSVNLRRAAGFTTATYLWVTRQFSYNAERIVEAFARVCWKLAALASLSPQCISATSQQASSRVHCIGPAGLPEVCQY